MAELVRGEAVVHYETWGENGPWITLINGHNRPLNDFRMFGRRLVARGLRVLVLDNRGSGLTTVTTDFTLQDMVADVSALWTEIGIRTSYVVGISMGGLVAQMLASSVPDVVERLVLVSTTMRTQLIRRGAAPWSSRPNEVEHQLAPYVTPAFAERNKALLKGMAKQIATAVETGSFLLNSQRQINAIQSVDLSTKAASIVAATLVVHGVEDQVIPFAAAVELAGTISAARLEAIPEAGHLLLAERPALLYQMVADFVTPAVSS